MKHLKSRTLAPLLTIVLIMGACDRKTNKAPKQVAKGAPMRGAPMVKKKDAPKPAEIAKEPKVEPPKKSPEKKPALKTPIQNKNPVQDPLDKTTKTPKKNVVVKAVPLPDKMTKTDDTEFKRIPRTNKAKKKKKTKDYQKKFAALKDLKKGDKSLPSYLGFGTLSDFEYEIQWGVAKKDLPKQIPDSVLAWNGKKIRTRGYMLPLKMSEDGQVKTCFLLRDLGPCCFGGTPKMNYWVLVTVPEGVKGSYKAYRAVEITGTISIGEKVEFDRVTSIYRLTASKVDWSE